MIFWFHYTEIIFLFLIETMSHAIPPINCSLGVKKQKYLMR